MTKSANELRGESKLSIAGESFVLRPTYEALVATEAELGSLFALVERASEGALTLNEITALLWHCLPSESRPDREVVGAQLLELGLVNAIKPIRSILSQVLQGRP